MKQGSCLKSFNFENMTKDEIIEKYESVLESREIQITDLSMELGKVQEKNLKFEEKLEFLENENKVLKEENSKLNIMVKKKDKFLTQELQNKEHMFMRIEEKELECDTLKKKINDLELVLNSSGKKKDYNFNIFKELISGSSEKDKNTSNVNSEEKSNKNEENTVNNIKISSNFSISDNSKELETKSTENLDNNTKVETSTSTMSSIVR